MKKHLNTISANIHLVMMMLIDGKERKKLITDVKRYGGITIPRMKLQVHQSGAKFPISKVYVDDEQLNPDKFYTLVIIPEGTSVAGVVKAVILSVIDDGIPIPEIVSINEATGIHNYKRNEIKGLNSEGLNHDVLMNISNKSLNLLAPERPEGNDKANFDAVRFFGILPYPEVKMIGLTHFFFIPDPIAQSKAREASITMLVSEGHNSFVRENMATLRSAISECAFRLFEMFPQDALASIIEDLLKTLNNLIEVEL